MTQKRLFNLPDNEYQYWNPFEYSGKLYNFEHLKAKKLEFKNPYNSDTYKIYTTISHHVFTVGYNQKKHSNPAKLYAEKPVDKREFCNERYSLSFHLPKLLETLPEQFCYHGSFKKYCVCKLNDENNNPIFYQVVFRVWKVPSKIRLHVESAYPLGNRPSKPKKVGFYTICYNLLRNKKMPIPPNHL